MKQIIINHEELQIRAAVVKDGELEDFFFERTKRDQLVGSIFKGKIRNMEPSLQAAFVDIGVGKNAFLHYWDMIPATEEMLEGDDDKASEEDDAIEFAAPENFSYRPRRRRGNGGANAGIEGEAQPAPVHIDDATQRKLVPLIPTAVGKGGENPRKLQSSNGNGSNNGQGRPNRNNGRRNRPDKGKLVPLIAPAENESKPQTGFFKKLCQMLGFAKEEELQQAKAPAKPQNQPQNSPKNNGRGKNGSEGKLLPLTKGASVADLKQAKSAQPANTGDNAQNQNPRPSQKKKKPQTPTIADIPKLFKEGQDILVQVTKGPIGTKGARVTTNLSIPGRYLVLLPGAELIGVSRRVEEKDERKRLKQMLKSLTLPAGMGLIGRTAGAGSAQEHFQKDLDVLLDYWKKAEELSDKNAPIRIYQEPGLVERLLRDCLTEDIDEIITDSEETYKLATSVMMRYKSQANTRIKLYQNPTPIFIKYGISKQIENISDRKVKLPSGGYLCIDETEALIAIDVNSGKNHAGSDQSETILTTNMEAVKEIARQLRLRNIGGLVILDLIDMRSKKDQQAVYRAFKEYLAADRARIKTYPISNLGLIEMSRQRESESLESEMFENCPYCEGRGLIKNAISISAEIQRRLNEILARKKDIAVLEIEVHPRVMERLKNVDGKVMEAMAAEYNRKLIFKSNAGLHIEKFTITDQATGKQL